MKRVVIVFGEMGSGKSYLGPRIAQAKGLGFFDGDAALPPELAERVRKFQSLPADALRDYITVTLYEETLDRVAAHPKGIVLAQALYNRMNRESLVRQFKDAGLEVECVWVHVSLWRNFKQISNRGWRWVLYWLARKPYFERPS